MSTRGAGSIGSSRRPVRAGVGQVSGHHLRAGRGATAAYDPGQTELLKQWTAAPSSKAELFTICYLRFGIAGQCFVTSGAGLSRRHSAIANQKSPIESNCNPPRREVVTTSDSGGGTPQWGGVGSTEPRPAGRQFAWL